MEMEKVIKTISSCIENGTLKKLILSAPKAKDGKRCVCKLVKIKGKTVLQAETVYASGGASHENIPLDECAGRIKAIFEEGYGQLNIIDIGGEAQAKLSKGGKLLFFSKIRQTSEKVEVSGQNREKDYILSPDKSYDFLIALGIQDENGRVRDKKQSKFRQINKFLEIIETVTEHLPQERIVIWDLCCGKSYLSFAAYYYFNFILNKKAVIYGVDLKKDVIEYCSQVSKRLKYDDLIFLHGDINETPLPQKPDMVMSLHACDIATDIVLCNAVKSSARVILSTPCCQHELADRMKGDSVDFITKYPIFKQKFAALATDAIRCCALEELGYSVTCLEFIDPEETPKNTMIKAIRSSKQTNGERYMKLCKDLNARPHFESLFNN